MVVDESGDLGKYGSENFAMTAVVVYASRDLLSASKEVSKKGMEIKYVRSNDEDKTRILSKIIKSDAKIVTVVKNKRDQSGNKTVYGSKLYKETLFCLIDEALNVVETNDVDIIVDSSFFIDISDLRIMCQSLCSKHGKNLKKCSKGVSQNNPCVRIADFASGAIWAHYEHSDDTYYNIIKEITTIVELKHRPVIPTYSEKPKCREKKRHRRKKNQNRFYTVGTAGLPAGHPDIMHHPVDRVIIGPPKV